MHMLAVMWVGDYVACVTGFVMWVVTMHLLLHLHTTTCCVGGHEGTCPFTLTTAQTFSVACGKGAIEYGVADLLEEG